MQASKGNRRGEFYWIDDKPYVSVTNILSVIDKPALRYWFGDQVYNAMIVNPNLNRKAALSAPYQKSDAAANRGTTVHSIVESYQHTKEHVDSIDKDFQGYAQAFFNWVEDNDVDIMIHEKTVISKQYGFAGTLDLLVKFRKSNKVYLIDVKTGKDIYPEAYLQLSAYKQALREENITVDHIAVVLLRETGTYKFGQGEEALDVFLSAKRLWEWKNTDLMSKFSLQPTLNLEYTPAVAQSGLSLAL